MTSEFAGEDLVLLSLDGIRGNNRRNRVLSVHIVNWSRHGLWLNSVDVEC